MHRRGLLLMLAAAAAGGAVHAFAASPHCAVTNFRP